MTEPTSGGGPAAQRSALERVRTRYERLGYEFAIDPDPSTLPAFLASFRPDAIAMHGAERILIEVKDRRQPGDPGLAALRRRLEGQPGWRLSVVYAGEADAGDPKVPAAAREQIREVLARDLAALGAGHAPMALVSAFTLLEAAQRLSSGAGGSRPQRPGTVVQSLAMDGLIDADAEAALRRLADARNRIVHGDFGVRVDRADVRLVLGAATRAVEATPEA